MDYFENQIPLLKPWIDDDELREVEEVLKSGWISQGRKVKSFEDSVAAFVGAPHAVAVNSATSAMHLGFQVSGLKRGDHVIVPAHTCMATANAIILAGGIPVFADIDSRTFNMEPAHAEAVLNDRVTAITVVHQIGLPADLDGFRALAAKHGLFVVEDAATAFGAKYRGRYLGSYGNPAIYSLHPRKMITTGEGGILMLFNEDWDERARRLRSAGASISDLQRHNARGTLQQDYPEPGYNYRLTDIQAAVGIAQLRKAERMISMRAELRATTTRRSAKSTKCCPPTFPTTLLTATLPTALRFRRGRRILLPTYLATWPSGAFPAGAEFNRCAWNRTSVTPTNISPFPTPTRWPSKPCSCRFFPA